MSNQEKRHRSSMHHLRYLDSFMDDIDREVMSLTDRAFKSLCIGDEAIYNDSEFSPSLVSCHKPMVEDVSKKTQQSSYSALKKLKSYPLNGGNDPLSRSNKSSKDSLLFAASTAKKNGESSKMTNGDSWDKSALLSIQRELSEISSDYHSLRAGHLSQAKNNLKSDEKGSAKKSSKVASNPPGKSSKSKQSKNNKLKKLNCINFFLHSEFSPFLSWGDFNKFSIRQEHISEIVLSNRPPEWYDSPLYKELTAAHGHYKLSVPPSVEKEVEMCPKQSETHPLKPQLGSVQTAAPNEPPKPEKESGHIQQNIPTKAPPLVAEQRCNSERVEACIPWRKSRSRAKSAAPVGHSINLPACEKTNAGEGSAQEFKKEVKTMEDQNFTSSTPFSISQLLTPVIPSRHGTESSEILQTVLSPTALEIPALSERELHPSPEIKREGYKSIASSLLYNLKDNRKRVKAMYSPPKFKGLDSTNQSKESPQLEVSKDVLEIPDNSEAKTISPGHHKAIISPMSPLLETANGGMPDDYLALSLLQSGKLKSNRSPATNKAKYPSLKLYQKASAEEIRENAQTVVDVSSQVSTEKASKDHDIKHNYPSKLLKGVELRNKNDTLESMLNAKKLTKGINSERTIENKSGKSPGVSLTKLEEQAISDGTNQIKDRLETRGTVSAQKSPVREKESNRKEAGTKHAFSARQNNYIKSQRFVSTDDDKNHDDSSNAEEWLMDIKIKNVNDECSRHSKNTKTKEIRQEEHNEGICKNKGLVQTTVDGPLLKENVHVSGEATTAKEQSSITSKNGLESQREQKVKDEIFSVKGNTSAKRALFASMELVPNKSTAPLKRDNVVIDKYDLAKMALEEVIAEREQRTLKNNACGCEKPQDDLELPNSGEDKLPSMFMLNEMGTSTKYGKGQNSISTFETNWQTVQTKSEDMAKHGESHVPEVKLARPCEQEAFNGQRQHAEPIKYNERARLCLDHQESNTNNISKGDKIHQKKELMNKNINQAMKCTKMGGNLESRDICSVGQYEEELGVDKRGSSYKPEITPKRGRSDSHSNEGVGEKTEGNLEFKREGETTGKTEIMESREIRKVQSSQTKNRGPVRGNVSALKEKYNKEIKVNRKDFQKDLPVGGTCSEKSMEERTIEKAPKDKMKHKFVPPQLTVCDTERGTYSIINNQMVSESEIISNSSSKESERSKEHFSSQRKHSQVTQDFQKDVSDLTNNINEGTQDKAKTNEKEEGADKQNKSKGPKVYVKDFLSGVLGLSSSERVKTVDELEEELSETLSAESFKPDKVRKDSITVYDILGQSHSVSSLNGKQTHHSSCFSNSGEPSLLHESEQGAQPEELLRKAEVCNMKEQVDEKVKDTFQKPSIDSCSLSNHESESNVSDRVVSPPSDVDKRGWVHSLIESARNLTQIPHSRTSSEDKQNNCLKRSEKDEEDLDLFKDHSQVEMPVVSVKSPQPNQPEMQFLSVPATHLVTVKDRKSSVGSASVSEEEERCSAVSTLSEGIDGYETSRGDMMDENIFNTAPREDREASKAPSERSASASSGNDSQGQNKPPVVPPKTEKALRRAMKLTTRMIQKAEAKSKSEQKGDKSVAHKAERRNHCTDKVHDRSEHRSLSSDRISSKQSKPHDYTVEHKAQRSEKHGRRHNGHKSQNVEENDPSAKVPHETKGKDTGDSKTHRNKKQQEGTSNHGDDLENGQISNDSARLGRSNEKYLPKKLERRTQSLDRFLRDKPRNISSSSGKTGVDVHSTEGITLRHNSIEHNYAPDTNFVTQSFPMTQRKLLQDPDSGEYFLVDMPVQVKTKTFFDPETKSYVQLPVQSPETAVRQAPPLEIMNTPPLMLYHGFVPVPLPSQKSVMRTGGSMIPPDNLEDFEPSRKQMQETFYKTHNEEVNPYSEPVYISQEHTPEDEIDSVR
ncbi:uncharacterized protein LOC113112058 [Carassius auratus]|uniref:Uncharacterized protein LOC113112058 n=1 Tax=Carassius auratus TaxID=7957 RepID=A0A6P6QLR5_CARAU|nr:uncharacterized protein LOC113112058 [Carassius auratus]